MYVHCENVRCFWHSDIEPNKCTRELIIVGEDANCKMVKDKKKHQITAKKFIETYCNNCGSQRCEGVGTVWFDGCKFKDYLKQ